MKHLILIISLIVLLSCHPADMHDVEDMVLTEPEESVKVQLKNTENVKPAHNTVELEKTAPKKVDKEEINYPDLRVVDYKIKYIPKVISYPYKDRPNKARCDDGKLEILFKIKNVGGNFPVESQKKSSNSRTISVLAYFTFDNQSEPRMESIRSNDDLMIPAGETIEISKNSSFYNGRPYKSVNLHKVKLSSRYSISGKLSETDFFEFSKILKTNAPDLYLKKGSVKIHRLEKKLGDFNATPMVTVFNKGGDFKGPVDMYLMFPTTLDDPNKRSKARALNWNIKENMSIPAGGQGVIMGDTQDSWGTPNWKFGFARISTSCPRDADPTNNILKDMKFQGSD